MSRIRSSVRGIKKGSIVVKKKLSPNEEGVPAKRLEKSRVGEDGKEREFFFEKEMPKKNPIRERNAKMASGKNFSG